MSYGTPLIVRLILINYMHDLPLVTSYAIIHYWYTDSIVTGEIMAQLSTYLCVIQLSIDKLFY